MTFRRFLLIWLPLMAVLGGVVWSLYLTQTGASRTVFKAAERQVVQLARHAASTELSTIRSDVLYLADQAAHQDWSAAAAPTAQARLAADYLAFAARKKRYDQVRFLDEHGREVVRINWNNGRPEAVRTGALQDKSGRDYVRRTLALERDDVYVSPFDLNIEHGAIEQPLKPVLRFSTSVFDQHGRKRGIVVLNYLGQRLIDRVKAVAAHTPSALWLVNDGGYWLIGPRAEDEWGFMYPDPARGRFDARHPEAWASIKAGAQPAQFAGDDGLYTYGRVSPDPSQSWVLLTHVPAAKLAALTAPMARDLAVVFAVLALLLAAAAWAIAHYSVQRRLAAARIRASEARFRGLLESAPDAIISTDRGGRIVLANAQAENAFGYARGELVGQPLDVLVPERLREHHRGRREAYQAHPHLRPMGAGLDLRARRKDGSEFPVEISLSPQETDQGMLVTAIVRDITARRQAEQARYEAQARYRELVNNLPVGVYRNTAGPAWRFLEANPAIVAMFEADSAEDFLTHSASDFYRNPDDQQAFSDKIMRQGFVVSEALELVTLKGRLFWGAITAAMKQDADGSIYFDGVIEDITERKEAECRLHELSNNLRNRTTELEAINHELEAFSYSVSHDLRAPLRAIDGFSRILLDDHADQLGDAGRDRLERVRRAAQHMAALIDDLLKLSRMTRAELTHETVDLSALAEEVFNALRKQEPQRVVDFTVSPGLSVHGDRRLLRVVLDNLLGNAWKFTGGHADARIEVGAVMHRGVPAYFVRDNGAGFDMAYADKLFGAFQRLHSASAFPGTGIGLATAQRVIHKHGGHIWAEAAVDRGATFYFTLQAGESP